MKRITAIIFFLFLIINVFFLPLATAGSSSHKRSAEKVLELTGSQKTLNQTVKTLVNNQLRRNSNLTPYKEMMRQFFEQYVGFEALKKNLVISMTKEFTEKELNEIIAFYETTAGRKTIEKMPFVIAKEISLGAGRIKQNTRKLEEMITAAAKETKKTAE